MIIQINGKIYTTDSKYLLPICADERASIYETSGEYTIYDLILENEIMNTVETVKMNDKFDQ